MPLSSVNLPFGIQPDYKEAIFTARAGYVCEGYSYPLTWWGKADLMADQTVTTYTMSLHGGPGGHESIWANVGGAPDPTLRGRSQKSGFWVVALESAEDTKSFRGLVYGITKAKVSSKLNTAISVGAGLWMDASTSGVNVSAGPHLEALDLSGSGGSSATLRRVLAVAMEDYAVGSTPSDGTTMYVNFDGYHGFGSGYQP